MRLLYDWLREYVPVRMRPEQLAAELTLRSIEVESVRNAAGTIDAAARVALVKRIRPHPNADRLRLATVDTGGKPVEVVCGAANLAEGQKVAYLPAGAHYLDQDGQTRTLRPTEIRGVLSQGMIASERELGLGDGHEGILVLSDDAVIGRSLRQYLGSAVVFELAVLANRGDCMGHLGVAREVAAITGVPLRMPPATLPHRAPGELPLRVSVETPDLCPRWSALVLRNVRIQPSPVWLQRRLNAVGIRPINNVVDLTNYLMADRGQPMHAFDYDRIQGQTMRICRLTRTTAFTTLDGVGRTLPPGTGVIRDAKQVIDLAGIMGGQVSAVTDKTRNVILQAAAFDSVSVRVTSRKIGHRTDAVGVYEKGVDVAGTMDALARAWTLLQDIAPGATVDRIVDLHPRLPRLPVIAYRPARADALLGTAIPLATQRAILRRLGCAVRGTTARWQVTPPSWRHDLLSEEDCIEDVCRINGYDVLPATLPTGTLGNAEPVPELELERRVKHLLAGYGWSETIQYPFTSATELQAVGTDPAECVRIANPLSANQLYLRRNLLPGMLRTVRDNLRYQNDVRIFTLAKVFRAARGTVTEERVLEFALSGEDDRRSWLNLRGVVDQLLDDLGIAGVTYVPAAPKPYAALRVDVYAGTQRLGSLHLVHPQTRRAWKIKRSVVIGSLLHNALLHHARPIARYAPMPTLPAVTRDVACWVPTDAQYEVLAHGVAATVRGVLPQVDTTVTFLDEYVGNGRRSLAFRLTFVPLRRTLQAHDVDQVMERVSRTLKEQFHATLRS